MASYSARGSEPLWALDDVHALPGHAIFYRRLRPAAGLVMPRTGPNNRSGETWRDPLRAIDRRTADQQPRADRTVPSRDLDRGHSSGWVSLAGPPTSMAEVTPAISSCMRRQLQHGLRRDIRALCRASHANQSGLVLPMTDAAPVCACASIMPGQHRQARSCRSPWRPAGIVDRAPRVPAWTILSPSNHAPPR